MPKLCQVTYLPTCATLDRYFGYCHRHFLNAPKEFYFSDSKHTQKRNFLGWDMSKNPGTCFFVVKKAPAAALGEEQSLYRTPHRPTISQILGFRTF